MRQEVLTNIERRRRWSDAEKRSILAEVGVKGGRVADVARRHDLTPQHIYPCGGASFGGGVRALRRRQVSCRSKSRQCPPSYDDGDG